MRLLPLLVTLLPVGAMATQARSMGTIEGRVTFAGQPPEMPEQPRFLPSGQPRDPACATHQKQRWLVVTDGGVADVLVRLPATAVKTPPPAAVAVIDQKDCVYLPRVLPVVTGQQIAFRNSDPTMHNLHAHLPDGTVGFNEAQPRGFPDKLATISAAPGEKPYRVTCDVHPWMETFLMVSDHGYATVTGGEGRFQLSVPVGTYELQAWHPNLGTKTVTVKVGPRKTVVAKFPPYRPEDYRAP
jgi:plastocyanin